MRPSRQKIVLCEADTSQELREDLVNKGPTQDPNRITAGSTSTGRVSACACIYVRVQYSTQPEEAAAEEKLAE